MTFNEGQYQSLYQQIVNGLNHAVSLVNHIIHIVEDATSWIPFVGDAIKGELDKLVAKMNQFTQSVMQHLKAFEVPSYLNSFSGTWTGIEQATGNLASGIAGEAQTAGHTWAGVAGGAYQQGVSNQAPAVSGINGLAASLSSAAEGVANAGFVFFVAAGAAIVTLCIGLAGAELVFPAIAAIIAATLAIGGAYTNLRIQISTNSRTLQGKLAGSSALPGGSWPLATAS